MDLVLVKGIHPIACIEIKTTNDPALSRGFYESFRDLKCNKGFVVTPWQETSYRLDDNIVVAGLHDFLSKKLTLLLKQHNSSSPKIVNSIDDFRGSVISDFLPTGSFLLLSRTSQVCGLLLLQRLLQE